MTSRRLAAILAADVVGFSKLIGEDEAGTLAALREIRKCIINPVLAEHGGRIFKLMGDGMLAEFPSAVQALRAAMDMQNRLRQRNAEASSGRRIEVRIGVHQGDVVVEGADLLGDGVNIAARLEALAEPGGICISGRVHEDATGKIVLKAQDMGEQSLKNIARPVRAYRVSGVSGRSEEQEAPRERPALPLPDKPSLAVLPFQNMSGDPEQEYFADGMVEEIITALSRVRSFFVIARNSSFTYKGRSVDVKQVGRELGVRYVVEGSVRKAAGRVRITCQLIEAETNRHVWADRFEGSLEDVFELQDSITQSVVGAIAPRLQQAEIGRALRKRTTDLSAYDLVLRALPNAWSASPQKNAVALNLLVSATEIDPGYAYAYALAAWCLVTRRNSAWPSWKANDDQLCLGYAKEAIRLDKDDPTVLWTAAAPFSGIRREHEYALELTEHSLAIDPNSAPAWMMNGWVYVCLARVDEGIAAFEKALRLSPLDPLNFLVFAGIADCHNVARRHEAAIEWCLRSLREHSFAPAQRGLAGAYARLGRFKEAREVAKQILDASPGFTITKFLEVTVQRDPGVRAYTAESLRLAGLPE
jgi:adenylate cyclase